MRNLFSPRRRHALTCLVAAGALVAAAGCDAIKEPVKDGPQKPPPPTGLSISPTAHDFGDATVGNLGGPAREFTVTNNGPNDPSGTLDVDISPNGDDFQFIGNMCDGAMLDAGASCTVTVIFRTASQGAKEAELLATSDDEADGMATAALTGNGIP